MKRKKFILTMLAGSALVALRNLGNAQPSGETPDNKKKLVVFFSHSGNTRTMARQIKSSAGADLFELRTVNAYPDDYGAVTRQAKKEINDKFRPELKSKPENLDPYDVIFVGSPNWWTTVAPPIATFLASYDLSGKTIVPFITHEGSRMGRSEADIKELAPQSTVLKGLSIRGSSVRNSKDPIEQWLREINLLAK